MGKRKRRGFVDRARTQPVIINACVCVCKGASAFSAEHINTNQREWSILLIPLYCLCERVVGNLTHRARFVADTRIHIFVHNLAYIYLKGFTKCACASVPFEIMFLNAFVHWIYQ